MKRPYLQFILLSFFIYSHAITVTETNDRSEADLKVYVTKNRSEADLIVCWVNDVSLATGGGLWFKQADKNLSEKTIFYVQDRFDADKIIYITDNKNEAGRP